MLTALNVSYTPQLDARTVPDSAFARHGRAAIAVVGGADATAAAQERTVSDRDACVTTLDRDALLPEERDLLVFSAPPPRLPAAAAAALPTPLLKWKRVLQGHGTLVIITNDPPTLRLLRKESVPCLCVEHTDEGLPRFDSMLQAMHGSLLSNRSGEGIAAYVNSDVSVQEGEGTGTSFDALMRVFHALQTTPLEVQRANRVYDPFVGTGKWSNEWFAVASRVDVDEAGDNSTRTTAKRHTMGGYDFWAWNIKNSSSQHQFLPFQIPPFRFPMATYDNWLLHAMITSAAAAASTAHYRNVIDISAAVTLYHANHVERGMGTRGADWRTILQQGTTGVYLNRHLAFLPLNDPDYQHIRYVLQHGTPLSCPYAVGSAGNAAANAASALIEKRKYFSNLPQDDPAHLLCAGRGKKKKTKAPGACPQRSHVERKTLLQSQSVAFLPVIHDATSKQGEINNSSSSSTLLESTRIHWRYTMEEQLKQHATPDKYVLLTAVNYSYRHHLLNFKCSLERVGMNQYFVIAAMDMQVYHWGVLQGLPIFLANSSYLSDSNDTRPSKTPGAGGRFGSGGFAAVTKKKSQVVLDVLQAGYSVLWSDVDITWFVHPFDALLNPATAVSASKAARNVMAIQSDAPWKQNARRRGQPDKSTKPVYTEEPTQRLNSGLYLVPSTSVAVAAFQDIVAHARQSNTSEQPSFDAILCGNQRENASCTYQQRHLTNTAMTQWNHNPESAEDTLLHIHVLDRHIFPNGATLAGPQNQNVYMVGPKAFSKFTSKPLYCIHNNWMVGEARKKQRAKTAGFWFLDENNQCMYPTLVKE